MTGRLQRLAHIFRSDLDDLYIAFAVGVDFVDVC